MRTETLWQGERRAARTHWWRQVLERPAAVNRKDLFDEELAQRFWHPERKYGNLSEDCLAATSC